MQAMSIDVFDADPRAHLVSAAASAEELVVEMPDGTAIVLMSAEQFEATISDLDRHRVRIDQSERLAQLGYWEWDEFEDRCSYCSEGLAKLHGVSVEAFLARASSTEADLEWIHPEDRHLLRAAARTLRETGESYTVEYRLALPDGRYVEVREEAEAVFDARGEKVVRSFGIVQAVNANRAAMAAHQQREVLLKNALQAAHLGVWVWDEQTDMVDYCSEGAAQLLGLSVEEYVATRGTGRTTTHQLHPDDKARYQRETQTHGEAGTRYVIEFRERRADGPYRHFLEIGESFIDAKGRLKCAGILQDIEERKQAEAELERYRHSLEQMVLERTQQLRASEARYRLIFDSAAVGIGRVEIETGELCLCNRQMAAILGFGEVKSCMEGFVCPPDFLELIEATAHSRRGAARNGLPVEHALTDARDRELTVQLFAAPSSESGQLELVLLDVSEQRAAEVQLHRAQRMETVGQLTGGVAHDFNNLLAIVQGYAELLMEVVGEDSAALREILHACTYGAELTHRLLAFSRRQQLEPQPTDVSETLTSLLALLNRTLGEQIDVRIRVERPLPNVLVDPAQFENVLLNLCLNARDAMPDGGRILIVCRVHDLDESFVKAHEEATPGRYVAVSVTDSGTGMSPAVLERAVEPFFTTKEVGKGSGLGLSMAFGFAKQSDGYLDISTELNSGTTVDLYLPLTDSALPESLAVEPSSITPGSGELVLLVEDEPTVRNLTIQMVEVLGYRVEAVSSIDAARQLLEGGLRPALILSDIVLRGSESGRTLAEWVHRHYPRQKVVLMSGFAPEGRSVGEGHLDLSVKLTKPFLLRDLARVLQEALR